MSNMQQNLLITLALGLCGLCVYQWYGQTLQREKIEELDRLIYQQSVAIQGYTNTIATTDRQVAQMDARLTELKASLKTNENLVRVQSREMERLRVANDGLTNAIVQYRQGVQTLEDKIKEAYAGIQQQNAALKEAIAQRDDFVKKLNEAMQDRNAIVNKYNDLVRQVAASQGGGSKK